VQNFTGFSTKNRKIYATQPTLAASILYGTMGPWIRWRVVIRTFNYPGRNKSGTNGINLFSRFKARSDCASRRPAKIPIHASANHALRRVRKSSSARLFQRRSLNEPLGLVKMVRKWWTDRRNLSSCRPWHAFSVAGIKISTTHSGLLTSHATTVRHSELANLPCTGAVALVHSMSSRRYIRDLRLQPRRTLAT
jgi:hypothetical protein